MSTPVIAVHLIVHGIVQGVFFRKHTKEKADELIVSGTVCNRPDGSVEIHAEGSRERIEALIDWCRIGPPRATVNRVDIHDATVKNYSGFVILR